MTVATSIAELLAPFDLDEDEFAAALAADLAAVPDTDAGGLTAAEAEVLRAHGGIAEPANPSVPEAVLRSMMSNLAALTRDSIAVGQAAALLGVDSSRVRHRVRDRALYAFKIGGALRLPNWQFDGHEPIPGLRAVLAALPADLHPLEVTGFMTTPDPDLTVGAGPLSPRAWLRGGGDSQAVVELITHLDAW